MDLCSDLENEEPLCVEIYVCCSGLKLAWDMGLRKVMLEIDSINVIDLVNSELNVRHRHVNQLKEIKEMMSRE